MSFRARVVSGAVLLLLTAQYFVGEAVAAATWVAPVYSWSGNYISDLGATSCSATVCSPGHAVMNATFAVHATLVLLAVTLLAPLLPSRRIRLTVWVLFMLNALGNVLVAVFALDPAAGGDDRGHYVGAVLAIAGGVVAITFVGVVCVRDPRRRMFGALTLVCGGIALVGLVLLQTGSSRLPAGTLERLAVDPIIVWYVLTGVILLVLRRPRTTER